MVWNTTWITAELENINRELWWNSGILAGVLTKSGSVALQAAHALINMSSHYLQLAYVNGQMCLCLSWLFQVVFTSCCLSHLPSVVQKIVSDCRSNSHGMFLLHHRRWKLNPPTHTDRFMITSCCHATFTVRMLPWQVCPACKCGLHSSCQFIRYTYRKLLQSDSTALQ